MRANAMPGCVAKPRTILCKTESTRCSEVTVTAKASSGSAASEIPTKPSLDSCAMPLAQLERNMRRVWNAYITAVRKSVQSLRMFLALIQTACEHARSVRDQGLTYHHSQSFIERCDEAITQ